jgi:hypothetical protein
MKLGICYMVFDGEELLEFAARNIRKSADYISATYQTTSYFGNPADPSLFETVSRLKAEGLLDEIIHFDPDLSLHPKYNELKLRNIGLEASRKAGCTHHISSDVDEFYTVAQFEYAKKVMDDGDYNYSVVPIATYYKDPTFRVIPDQDCIVSFIHPVANEYTLDVPYPIFPFHMETTRRFKMPDKSRLFTREEITQHHMSYIRKDIRKKFKNSDNGRFYKIEKFVKNFESYKLGDRVCLVPDFINRRTTRVENTFGIKI